MISGVILAHDEERHIVDCIEALKPHVEEVILIDTESRDRTVEFARPLVDRILSHENIPNFDAVRNLAIPAASFNWLWFVDADERIPACTGAIVRRLIRDQGDEFEAINIPFKSHFCGQWMKHCGWWPGYTCARVLKKGHFEFSRTLHGGVVVQGREVRLPPDGKTAIEHYSFRDLHHYIDKFNRYTSTEALQLAERDVTYDWRGALRFMVHDLWQHYELNNARLDGERGWILTWMAGQYRWLSVTKLIDHGHSSESRGGPSSVPADLDEFLIALEEELATFRAENPEAPLGLVWRGAIWEDSREAVVSRQWIALLAATSRPLRIESHSQPRPEGTCVVEAERRLLAALERCRRARHVVTITQLGQIIVSPDRCACVNVLQVMDGMVATGDLMPLFNAYDEVWAGDECQVQRLQSLGAAPERLRVVPSPHADEGLAGDDGVRLVGELRRIDESLVLQARPLPSQDQIRLILEGEFGAGHSFSNINEQLALRLAEEPSLAISLVHSSRNSAGIRCSMADRRLRAYLGRQLGAAPHVVIRHSFPPNWQKPPEGIWIHIQPWEFGFLPTDWLPHLRDEVDEIWVMSRYVESVYLNSGVAPDKLYYVPWGVDSAFFRPDGPSRQLPTDKSFRFLYVGGTILRKGFDRLLAAYLAAFGPEDDVCLVIKDAGANSFYAPQCMREQVIEAAKNPNNPAILYFEEEMTPGQLACLYRACDCLVAPYRGEGFGLPVLEGLACGIPPIVPTGGPTDDFVDPQSGFLLPAVLVPAVGVPNLCDRGTELHVAVDDLRTTMRLAYEDRIGCQRRGSSGSQRVLREFSWESTIDRIVQRVHTVCGIHLRKVPDSIADRASASPADTNGRLGAVVIDVAHPMDLVHTLSLTRPFVAKVFVVHSEGNERLRQLAREYDALLVADVEECRLHNCDWVLVLHAGEYLHDEDLQSLGDLLGGLPTEVDRAGVVCDERGGSESTSNGQVVRLIRCTAQSKLSSILNHGPTGGGPINIPLRIRRSPHGSSSRPPRQPERLITDDLSAKQMIRNTSAVPEQGLHTNHGKIEYGHLRKPVLIQMASGLHVELLELTQEHHRRYAQRHGMDYWCIAGQPVREKRAGWGKVPLLIAAMELGYETAIWLDADAVIVRPEFDLSRLVDHGIGMVRHPSPPHWNTGLIVAKAGLDAFRFWQDVNAAPENDSAWMEQEAANALAKDPGNMGIVHSLDLRFNSVPGYAVANEPVIVAGHGLPMERRMQLLKTSLAALDDRIGQCNFEPRSRAEFGRYLNELGLVGEAAEIGVLRGENAQALLARWHGRMLHLVDPWRHLPDYCDISNLSDDEFEECLATTHRNLAPFAERYRIHRMESANAASTFADDSLDYVYLDANHRFDAVSVDLRLWYPKLRTGGIMAGHDFLDGELPEGSFGVASAVREFVRSINVGLRVTSEPAWPSWYFQKPSGR